MFVRRKKTLLRRKFAGFSLIETSMVLLIIGIVAGGILKGKDLIESSQLKSVVNDIQNLQIAFAGYVNSYGALPGDDNSASRKFGSNVNNGDGDGKISSDDAKKVLVHLHAAGLIDSAYFKVPKIGGSYEVISDGDVPKIKLSDHGNAFINRKQLIVLMAKATELLGENKGKLETEPELTEDNSKKYIVKMKLD